MFKNEFKKSRGDFPGGPVVKATKPACCNYEPTSHN